MLHNPTKLAKKTATITATMLQREVGIVLRRVAKGREHIIVERDGFPIVAVIPVDEYEYLTKNAAADTD